MKKNELKKAVELLARKNEMRKAKAYYLFLSERVMYFLGSFLIIIFVSHLILTHFLLLGIVSTLLITQGMFKSSILFSSMSAQFIGLLLLCIVGLCLMLLSKLLNSRRQELIK